MTPKTSTLLITLPKLYPLQNEIVHDLARFKVVVAGRRAGKTRMCSLLAIINCFKGKRVWWVSPTFQNCKIGFREVVGIVSQFPFPVDVKESTLEVKFPGKDGYIAFKSAEVPDNLRGEGIDFLVIDECDYVAERVWQEVLRPSLADRRGHAIFISTPRVENGWFHKLFLTGKSGKDPDVKSWHAPSHVNPFLDRDELDRAQRELPSLVYRREILAEFVSASGARVKQDWLKYEDVPGLEVMKSWKIALGADLAISLKNDADYTACAVLGRDPRGNIHVLDVARTRATFADQIRFIKSMADKWNSSIIAIEDVAYQRAAIQTVSAETSVAVRGIKRTSDKVAFFAPLEARYEHGQIIHARSLPDYFEQELLSFPVGLHDDCVDALSVAFAALKDATSIQSRPLPPVVNEYDNGSPHRIGKSDFGSQSSYIVGGSRSVF